MKTMPKRNNGFTLLELMMVLCVAIILSMAMTTVGHDWYGAHRATYEINRLLGAVEFARSSALDLGQVVTLCPSEDGETCSQDWSRGYLIFVDRERKGKIKDGKDRLQIFEALPKGASLEWRAFPTDRYVQFAPSGFTREQNGTFYYCPDQSDDKFARALIVDKSGRARVATQDSDGNPLVCH